MKNPPRPLLEPRPAERKQFATPTADFESFSAVYRKAAAELAGEHDKGGIWALPIVFLYRHAIETAIKAVLLGLGPSVGVCSSCVLNRSHDLKKQMPDLRKVAGQRGVKLSPEFEEMIASWQKHDPSGMRARYPTTKSGNPQIILNGERFRLAPFTQAAEGVLDELHSLLLDAESERYRQFLEEEGITDIP